MGAEIKAWHVKSYNEICAMLNLVIPRRDDWYWYPDTDSWVNIVLEAIDTAPSYKSITNKQRGYDCDKFARHLCDYAATKYMINSCFEVWGDSPQGYHAWNMIITSNGIFEIEPQNCSIWELGKNKSYIIREIAK